MKIVECSGPSAVILLTCFTRVVMPGGLGGNSRQCLRMAPVAEDSVHLKLY